MHIPMNQRMHIHIPTTLKRKDKYTRLVVQKSERFPRCTLTECGQSVKVTTIIAAKSIYNRLRCNLADRHSSISILSQIF